MTQILKQGDRGALVSLLQLGLKRAGQTPGALDGIFGAQTAAEASSGQSRMRHCQRRRRSRAQKPKDAATASTPLRLAAPCNRKKAGQKTARQRKAELTASRPRRRTNQRPKAGINARAM